MAITRINNNQITDAAPGNVYVGVNAAAKVQSYSVTAAKLANNITYDSSLTITGNLTVQGNTTSIDTVNLVVEDPIIILAAEQTGSPTVDIGFIGQRGTSDNIAWFWDENLGEFAAAFTTSLVTNTTVGINSYASVHMLDLTARDANITGNITFSGNIVGNVTVTGNVNADNLNATTNVTGTTITASGNLEGNNAVITNDVGAATITASGNVSGGNITTAGVVEAIGNVIGGNITTIGEVTATGNVAGGNVTTAGNVDGNNVNANGTVIATGNVAGGNITTAGVVEATGNVIGGNITTVGAVSATGNVAGGNITTIGNVDGANVNTTGTVIATGNVSGGNVTTAGEVVATGNVSGGNITTAGNVDGANVNATSGITAGTTVIATGNVSGGNITTAGVVEATGNVIGGNINATANVTGSGAVFSGNVTADTFIGNISGNIDAGGANTNIQFNDDDVLNGSAAFTFDKTSNLVTATGNISAGNLVTGGSVDATGNIIGGNLNTAGVVIATGNVSGGNITTAGNVDGANVNATSGITAGTTIIATGNVSGGNITTVGAVTATGNVSGGNITTLGAVDATGNVAGGNLITAGVVTATGNVSGGNITTAGNVDGANVNATAGITAGTTIIATGNVSGGNITTAGVVEATGNVAGGNITTAGVVEATGNVIGGNITTAGVVEATGNVSGGNVTTVGMVTATGNVSGGNLLTAGAVTATGNVSGGNVTTAGNVDANNVNVTTDVTAQNVIASGNVDGANVNTNSIVGTDIVITATSVDMNLTGNLILGSRYINQLASPLQPQDAATKRYVDDAVSSGIHIHTPVQLETPTALPSATYAQGGNVFTVTDTVAGNVVVFSTAANLQVNDQLWFTNSFEGIVANISYFVVSTPNTSAAVLTTLYNGTPVANITSNTGLSQSVRVNSGIGATLTAVANGALTVDSVAPGLGNRILVYNQITQYENGVYTVTDTGNVTAPWILTRATDSDRYAPDTNNGMDAGSYYFVQGGATGAGESYVMTAPQTEYIIGLDAVEFTQFSASQVYSANTQAGIDLTGTVFSAKVDNDTTAFDVGGNIKVKDGANLVTPNIGNAVGNSLTLTGNGLLSATTVQATGNITGGNLNSNAEITGATITASGNIDGGNVNVTSGITAGTTITATGNVSGGNITTAGNVDGANVNATSGITAGTTVTATGNVSGGNITTVGAVTATGNVSGGNITTIGEVTATGNVSGGNITTAGNVDGANVNATAGITAGTTVTATGNVSGGNITTVGQVVATGNVSAGNISAGSGLITTTGNIECGNIIVSNNVGSGTIFTSGNIDGGNINATANVTGSGAVFSGNVTADTFIGNISGNIDAAGANTNIQFNDEDMLAGSSAFTFDKTSNLVTATGNISAANLITGGSVDATGNVAGGNITTVGQVTATGNVSGGNITTAGNVDGANVNAAASVIATGNVAGGNITTAGEVIATGNIAGGNISAGSGTIVTTGNIDGGNINATANVTGSGAVFSGNVTADNFIGNIQGNIDAGGANTNIQFNDDDILAGSPAFTFDKTSNLVTATGNISAGNLTTGGVVIATGNVSGGNITTVGAVDATGNVAGGNITTIGEVTATGNVSGGNVITVGNVDGANVNATGGITAGTTVIATGNVSGGNITTAGVVEATGNVSGGNIITIGVVSATGNVSGGNITTAGTADLGNIRITGNDITNFASNIITINAAASDIDFRVSGDTVANLLLADAGTDTVVIGGGNATLGAALKVDTTDSMMPPVGNLSQRPGTPAVGMLRFSTTDDALEVYTAGDGWILVGTPEFTVITADEFIGNGACTEFTLSEDSTTAGTIVSINGIVQIPTTAYSVSGNLLTFTEAPELSDVIDARILTTTTTVTSIENSSGNAKVQALNTADTVQITGNLLPLANITYDLGSDSLRWRDGYFAGNSITLGNIVMKNPSSNVIAFFGPDGTTPATLDANVEVVGDAIESGTSNVSFSGTNGNVDVTVGGSPIVTFYSDGIDNRLANGVGNIGSETSTFNTIFAKATSAQYADLAEMYEADAIYEPGTVVCFGGSGEITACVDDACRRVAGVVSTNPSYIMNAGLAGDYVTAVALTGRVPTRVTGLIRKGDMLVAAGNGRARAESDPKTGSVIGKALADFSGADGVIEVVVGRL